MVTRVLLVEDEALIAMDLAAEIEARAFEVVGPFGREAEALAAIASEAIDLALLDMSLPEGDSFAVADALVARRTPVIFLSGHGRAQLPERFRDAPLLSKPVSYDTLFAAIAQARALAQASG